MTEERRESTEKSGEAASAARSLREVEATWSDETSGLLCLYLYAPGRRKAASVASTKPTTAEVLIDYDEAGAILGVEVIASVG